VYVRTLIYELKQIFLQNVEFCCVKREKTKKMQLSDVYYQLLSQHVSGIIMSIFRRTKTLCYCIWCTTLVLLGVVGSGYGALRCRMRALLAPYNAAPHNRYQPHPAEPAQHTTCSNTRSWSPEDGHNDDRNMLRQKLIINI